MGVEPHERDPSLPRGETLDGADVRAATAAEHERALWEIRGERERLFLERFRLDDRGFRKRELEPGSFGHRLAALPPRVRHSDEAGVELTSARMTLVVGPQCNGGKRLAVRTLRA